MDETVYLSGPSGSPRIHYRRAAMEEIRGRAVGGLLAVPRVPVGVGGLLIGVREKELIRILDSIEIPCSHSAGPGFLLTAEEKLECQNMMAEAGEADGSGRVTVVGWYCSKTRGDGSLSEEDRNFYREFFPESWQIALVVRPTALDDMPAVFYRRDGAGQVVKAIDCIVEAWRPEVIKPEPEAEGSIAPPAVEAKPPAEPANPSLVIEPVPAAPKIPVAPKFASPEPAPAVRIVASKETTLADLVGALSDEKPRPAATPRRTTAHGLLDVSDLKSAKQSRKPNMVMIAAGIGVLLILLIIGAIFTKDSWLPRPPLSMTSSEVNGRLLIRWNAEALRGIKRASLNVNDGGVLHTVEMDGFQINAGSFNYTPTSQRVSVKLDAGTVTGITNWFANPPPAPTPAAAAPGTQQPTAATPAPLPATEGSVSNPVRPIPAPPPISPAP